VSKEHSSIVLDKLLHQRLKGQGANLGSKARVCVCVCVCVCVYIYTHTHQYSIYLRYISSSLASESLGGDLSIIGFQTLLRAAGWLVSSGFCFVCF
jgi:hypothetical protein